MNESRQQRRVCEEDSRTAISTLTVGSIRNIYTSMEPGGGGRIFRLLNVSGAPLLQDESNRRTRKEEGCVLISNAEGPTKEASEQQKGRPLAPTLVHLRVERRVEWLW